LIHQKEWPTWIKKTIFLLLSDDKNGKKQKKNRVSF
jgi:hypothetical protein